MDEESKFRRFLSGRLAWVLGAAIFLVWLYASLPTLIVHHTIFYGLWVGLPYTAVILLYFGIPIVVYLFTESKAWIYSLFTLLIIPAVFLLFWYFPGVSQLKMLRAADPIVLETQPQSTGVRYLPFAIAENIANNQYAESKTKIDDLDPVILEDGNTSWVGNRVPSGGINALTKKAAGTITVPPEGEPYQDDVEFKCGEGMIVFDNLTYRLWREHFGVEIDEIYYAEVDGELSLVVPYLKYGFDFPVFTPYWGGVFIISPDCEIRDYSPAEAWDNPDLRNIRIVPESYALKLAQAWEYNGGLVNAWVHHVDQTEIPTISGEGNQMPYAIPTDLGELWYVGLEPYGPANSISKAVFVQTYTGRVYVFNYPKDAPVVSPNKAAGFIHGARDTTQWAGGDGGGKAVVIEPRPLFVGKNQYWMMSQSDKDLNRVNKTFLVRSTDEQVFELATFSDVTAFIETGELPATDGECLMSEGGDSQFGNFGFMSQILGYPVVPQDLSTYSEGDLVDLLGKVSDEMSGRLKD